MKKITIIDFGGQYTHLISRRIRELSVYAEIIQPVSFQIDKEMGGIILSGGPKSVDNQDIKIVKNILKNFTKPVLGICYGHQLLAAALGAKLKKTGNREYGRTEVCLNSNSDLFKGLSAQQNVWMSHGDNVNELPVNLASIGSTTSNEISAIASTKQPVFGVQFHPEVSHTDKGSKILDNFLKICKLKRNWKQENFTQKIITSIKQKVRNRNVFLLLSGGVDSLVTLELCIRALGKDKVHSLHIDTGFMRLNESEDIIKHLNELNFENIKLINAENIFLSQLEQVIEPEKKREIIGRLFVEIADKEMKKLVWDEDWLLAQGTIYPDTIESGGSKAAAKIKTHHNTVEEIEKLKQQQKVIEPLKYLYKDEVRKVGKELKLPDKLINRQPFPGPGLAIRMICSPGTITNKNFDKEAAVIQTYLAKFGLKGKVLPVKSVGVQGDFRTYHHPLVIWFEDNVKADWQIVSTVANAVLNRFKTINRVLLASEQIHKKPELNPLHLEKQKLDLLRKVDAFIHRETAALSEIWQMPVVALPLFRKGKQIFVMRPVTSTDAMTADFYKMSFDLITKIRNQLLKKYHVGDLYYDITTKPPGTIEWE